MVQGSAAYPSYEVSGSFAPWEYNTVWDNVVGALVRAVIVNVRDGRAPKWRLRMHGTAPGAGESLFVFPSDCFERSRRDDAFDVRDAVDIDEREGVCAELASAWKR